MIHNLPTTFFSQKTSYLVNDGSEREIDRLEAKVTYYI